jgi:hypothetical protein
MQITPYHHTVIRINPAGSGQACIRIRYLLAFVNVLGGLKLRTQQEHAPKPEPIR